jgi:pimeloyl-ACP methyl ester carboxylesterase
MARGHRSSRRPRRATSANRMECLTWGDGPRTLLFIPGGPPSALPSGLGLRMAQRRFSPYVEAGYTVWVVTRRRSMPPAYTMGDIAADYAEFVDRELACPVDVVVGESFGGLVAQHLAARHPDLVGSLTLVASGARTSAWARDVDARLAAALARGDLDAAGTVFAEYLLPGDRMRTLRRLLGPLVRRWVLSGTDYPASDVMVEAHAERDCDTRGLLPRVTTPVLLLAGDRDRFFPREVIEETAHLLPDCRLVWLHGRGHAGACSSSQVPRGVLAFAASIPMATRGSR